MLPQSTSSEVLDRLEALTEYLTKLKVRRIPERLLGAIAIVRELEEAQRRAAHRDSRRLWDDPAAAERRMQELVWSVVEGWQLATIFEGLRDYDPKVVGKQLLKALKGPLNPTDQSRSSNQGRRLLT